LAQKLTGFDLSLTGFNDLELGSLLADKTSRHVLLEVSDAAGALNRPRAL
jgi:hypothetical protein